MFFSSVFIFFLLLYIILPENDATFVKCFEYASVIKKVAQYKEIGQRFINLRKCILWRNYENEHRPKFKLVSPFYSIKKILFWNQIETLAKKNGFIRRIQSRSDLHEKLKLIYREKRLLLVYCNIVLVCYCQRSMGTKTWDKGIGQ